MVFSSTVFLLIASLLFYAYGEPIFVFFLIFSIFVNYYLGIKVSKDKNKKIYINFAYIYI